MKYYRTRCNNMTWYRTRCNSMMWYRTRCKMGANTWSTTGRGATA